MEVHFQRHEKLWCPERKNRPPGWEGREWDFQKKVFKPISKTTQQPPPSASSSSRSAPAERQRDSFASPPPLPQHPFAPGNSQYNRNDIYAAQLGGQGYQPNPFDPAPFSNQHLPQNSPFSPLHSTPCNVDHSCPSHSYHISLQRPPHAHNIPQTTALTQPRSFASSNSPYLFPNHPFDSYGLVPRSSTEQYYASTPTSKPPAIPTQTPRGSSRRGATSNVGRLPHSSPHHPYPRIHHFPRTSPVPVLQTRTETPSPTETPRSPGQAGDELFDFDAFANRSTHLNRSLRKLRLTHRQTFRHGQAFVL
ncbi:hypothetical protein JCM5353_000738 [Sporobolomyces roseus]